MVAKKIARTSRLGGLFILLLVGGTLASGLTGRGIFVRLGLVGALAAGLTMAILQSIEILRGQIHKRRLFAALFSGMLHTGIMFLVVYFIWFLLVEMMGLTMLAPVPTVKNSWLTLSGGFLIAVSVVALFGAAFLNRHKNSH